MNEAKAAVVNLLFTMDPFKYILLLLTTKTSLIIAGKTEITRTQNHYGTPIEKSHENES